jgi:hypothetical protein
VPHVFLVELRPWTLAASVGTEHYGVCVATDPAPFLSTIALASAGLVAIVGGLLVARFVSLDSDQRRSREVMDEASERLDAARRQAEATHSTHVDWQAGFFFRGRVLQAISEGILDPAVLIRLGGHWPFTELELRPYAEEVAEEFARACAVLSARGPAIDQFGGRDAWDDFRGATPDLPEVRWDPVWEYAFDAFKRERFEREAAERRERERERPQRTAYDPSGLLSQGFGDLAEMMSRPQYFPARLPARPQTDYEATWERQKDDLRTADEHASQQVAEREAEFARLQRDHAEIAQPDARLWWGVSILTVYAIVGVGIPMWELSRGPADLGQVRWIFYPFAGGLAVLIIYIIVYLAKLFGAPLGAPEESLSWPDRAMRALYTYEWHPRPRGAGRRRMWP